LRIEALERRALLSANVSLNPNNGILTITGDNGADVAIVRLVDTLVTVTVAGLEVLEFAAKNVDKIKFIGNGGVDEFRNLTPIRSLAYGGSGNDSLVGTEGSDVFYGGAGHDALSGGTGDDSLYGDDGDDKLEGGHGDDLLRGGRGDDLGFGHGGADRLYGDEGLDELHGGNDADRLWGGAHDDRIWGDANDDVIRGEQGHDTLWGGGHDDNLYGGAGRDALYGGSGADYLRGEDGNDGLFGGSLGPVDRLWGDAGRDRFLVQDGDLALDVSGADARLVFDNQSSAWSDAEIEVLDGAFARLHLRTANTALLKETLNSDPLLFVKVKTLAGGAISQNQLTTHTSNSYDPKTGQWTTKVTYTRTIYFANWDETDDFVNGYMASTAIHEIGHNWDSALEIQSALNPNSALWSQFVDLSGWRESAPSNPSGYNLSLDGQWWYLEGSQFAEYYGRTNPREDWSTVWELYFEAGGPAGAPSGQANLKAKLNKVDDLFQALM
jgi:hypothetical protein